jgi:hypothetical protein
MPASEWVFLQTNMNETRLVRTVPVSSLFCAVKLHISNKKNLYTEKFFFTRVQSHLSGKASSYMMKCENMLVL